MEPDEYDVDKYVHADRVISRLRNRRREIETSIYDKTLATHIEFDGERVHTVAPRIDRLVLDALDATEIVDGEIQRWQYRRAWFNQWLATLDANERRTITEFPQFAAQDLKDAAQEEIYQIETAVAYRCGYEPPAEHVDLCGDTNADIDMLADYFGDD